MMVLGSLYVQTVCNPASNEGNCNNGKDERFFRVCIGYEVACHTGNSIVAEADLSVFVSRFTTVLNNIRGSERIVKNHNFALVPRRIVTRPFRFSNNEN